MEQALERLKMLKAKEEEYKLKRDLDEPLFEPKKTKFQLEKEKMKKDLLSHKQLV